MMNPYLHWPKTGAILWQGTVTSSIEESEVYQFATALLCEQSLKSQALLKAQSHPDFYSVQPLEAHHAIKIDQIRSLIDWVQGKPQIASRKVALIYPAEALNLQAANALLKTLEELPLDTVIILLSSEPSTLPATVLSRCHWIRSKTLADIKPDPLQDQVAQDLQRLERHQIGPLALASAWLKLDVNRLLYWILVLLNQKMVLQAETKTLTKNRSLFYFLDKVYEARRSLQEQGQLNTQLILEALLIQYPS